MSPSPTLLLHYHKHPFSQHDHFEDTWHFFLRHKNKIRESYNPEVLRMWETLGQRVPQNPNLYLSLNCFFFLDFVCVCGMDNYGSDLHNF